MATTVDKIKEIESEMARTQKNKATSFHLGISRIASDRSAYVLMRRRSIEGKAC
ncbi:hypothetical protein BU26DRAFT_519168 [Trematosphaeria pertusa]|uniref:Uncharacterized protein n=1 Tax=Trematosphaeria pertusa TaxID=390896 RepID=A0A6A6IFN0_9PLEO|nr:uncharacterized protein BU26DRAFT_519168 [Trematosphaeria pertusa]KAF2248999.1 hypothetical protein BU26DRAFT_519168 [Trematosphaeria pertusa]